jgi:hypothetical protein
MVIVFAVLGTRILSNLSTYPKKFSAKPSSASSIRPTLKLPPLLFFRHVPTDIEERGSDTASRHRLLSVEGS